MYIHVCTCLCFSNIVHTMSVSCCTIAWYVHGTYMVQTCLYTFMPGGQDSRWWVQVVTAVTTQALSQDLIRVKI